MSPGLKTRVTLALHGGETRRLPRNGGPAELAGTLSRQGRIRIL